MALEEDELSIDFRALAENRKRASGQKYSKVVMWDFPMNSRSQTDAPAEAEIDPIASTGKMKSRLPNSRHRIEEEKRSTMRTINSYSGEIDRKFNFGVGFLKFPKSRREKEQYSSVTSICCRLRCTFRIDPSCIYRHLHLGVLLL